MSEAENLNKKNPNDRKIFEGCKITFPELTDIRYIKYQILLGEQGRSRLKEVKVFPAPEKISIHSCNSQGDNIAENLLNSFGVWESNPNDDFVYPHEVILDLNQITKVKSIITEAVYFCTEPNQHRNIMTFQDGIYSRPDRCFVETCKAKDFVLDPRESKMIDWQMITLLLVRLKMLHRLSILH